jgi:class 3 adenylate cyclase/tetratricopeptide (TPR) repeat protein
MESSPPSRESQRRYATVMFADVSGFTSLSGKLDPEEVTELMNECFRLLEECVTTHGGHVDKYIGDCIMALFGVPQALEHAARNAVNAAIEMRNRIAAWNAHARPPVAIGIHIGINSGLVLAGDVGGQHKRDFTVMGDSVNLASRLKDASPTGEIWVGAQTHSDTRLDIEYETLRPIALKGMPDPVPVYKVTSVRTQRYRARPTSPDRALFSDLVGRDTDVAALRRRLEALRAGDGAIVSVVGEAGLGKSRLIHEVIGSEPSGAMTVLEGRSLAMGANLRFHPFVDLLEQWAGIGDDDDPSAAARKLGAAVTAALGASAADALPFIGTLAGVRVDGSAAARLKDIDGDALEKLLAKHVRELLVGLTRTRPCVVVMEDLHWADQSSVKLLVSLLPLVREHPLLVVLVYRPDYARTSGAVLHEITTRLGSEHELVQLTPLDGRQCLQLLHNLLADHDRPHPAWTRILAKAAGNPFFVEEVVRTLIDQGAIVRKPQGYEVTEQIETAVVPATVQEVIMARVDRLPEHVRQLLQVASVVGRRVPYRLLEAVAPAAEHLTMGLAFLARAELLEERDGGGDATWTFTHALAHETIYESILLRTRKSLHLKVAEAIETLFADRLADFHGELAYHYTRGEQLEKAEEYLLKAGEDAARSAASEEALALFREASRVFIARYGEGGDPRKKAVLEKHIGLALLNRGDLSESIGHFDRALEHMGERVPKTTAQTTARFAMDFVAVLAQLYAGLKRSRTVTDWDREREVWQILFNRGRAEITSDPTRLFFDTVAGFRQLNRIDASRIDQAGALYASCASVFCYSGISFAVSRRALAIAKRLIRPDSVQDRFTCAVMDFTQDYLEGRWADGAVVDDALVDEALRYGQLWDANTYLGLRCDQQLRRGQFVDARALLDHLARLRDDYGYAFAGGNYDGMRALLFTEARRLDEAQAAIVEYLAGRHEDPLRTFGLGTMAKIQSLRGDLDGAAKSLVDAAAIVDRSRAVPPWHRSAYAAARLRHLAMRLEAGDPAARALAKQTIRYATRVSSLVALQRAEIAQLVGRVHWALGRRKAALAAWQRSVEVGESLGAAPEVARTYALLARHLGDERVGERDAVTCRVRAEGTFRALELEWDLSELGVVNRAA